MRAFMNSASPGLITAFQKNAFYPSHEAYLADLVDAMRPEYEAIVEAGFELQLDCPDLAMSRHTGYQHSTEEEFLQDRRRQCRGAQCRDGEYSRRQAAHAYLLGQLRRPARP